MLLSVLVATWGTRPPAVETAAPVWPRVVAAGATRLPRPGSALLAKQDEAHSRA